MLSNPKFSYIRMDRDVLPEGGTKISLEDYKKGFKTG